MTCQLLYLRLFNENKILRKENYFYLLQEGLSLGVIPDIEKEPCTLLDSLCLEKFKTVVVTEITITSVDIKES
jgi:hypothetical protein